jgi:hypothetical protein
VRRCAEQDEMRRNIPRQVMRKCTCACVTISSGFRKLNAARLRFTVFTFLSLTVHTHVRVCRDTFIRVLSIVAWSAHHGTALPEDGFWVMSQMKNMKMDLDEQVFSLMMRVITGAAKHGSAKLEDLDKLLELAGRDAANMQSYELAMGCLVELAARGGSTVEDGEKLLERMQAAGLHPPIRLYENLLQVAVLAAKCRNQAVLPNCERVLTKMQQWGEKPPRSMFGAVMAMLADEARTGHASVADGMRLVQLLEKVHGRHVWAQLTS